ncbi:MAG: helix-turn-helix domain-containing protein [Clostridia bacterium]|nr:helix-turn-helix domain-containing protein [Clostridia bacterium]
MTKEEVRELYKLMYTEYPDVVSITDLQKMLGIGRKYAYKLINDGAIDAIRIANAIRIPKINVINFVLKERATVTTNSNLDSN